MPITIKHGAVGTLGRLAVRAGQVRGQQLKMSRDIQLMGMVMASQERGADAAAKRAFRFQEAGAAQVARQPAEPDTLALRQKLRRFVSEAKASKIYDPAQIKQMEIFAKIGDEKAVRSIAGRLPQATVRRQELQNQMGALEKITGQSISAIKQQLDIINEQLGKQFTPGTQRLLRERPDFMTSVSPKVQELLAQQQQLEEQIVGITEQATLAKRMIGLGISFPEQAAIERRRLEQMEQKKALDLKQLIAQNTRTGKLTDTQDLQIDLMRGPERTVRNLIGNEITRLRKELVPLEGETEGGKKYLKRTEPIQIEVSMLMSELTKSHGRESSKVAGFVLELGGQKGTAVPKTYITPDGRKFRFSGEYEDGKPQYDLISEGE